MLKLAATFLLLSGIASLSYQVAWVRLLGLSMGSTSAAVSTVLAAFFLGLALGSYFAERFTRNRIDSLKIYVVIELIIGLSGLALLPILLNLDTFMSAFPHLGRTIEAKFFVSVILLSIPTIFMGATFPVMASILIRRRKEVGVGIGQLYSLNTAGAVLGAVLSGFVMIPLWGLDGTIYIAFAINMFIVGTGLFLDKRIKLIPLEIEKQKPEIQNGSTVAAEETSLRGRALIILFATGLVSIATEVGWTKYLSIFTGTTIFGFAAILTVFLMGIASGSWVIKSYLETMRRPAQWMAFGLILLGVTLLLTRAGLTLVPPIYAAINHFPVDAYIRHGVKYLLVFLLLFPATFLLGAIFPLNIKMYCGNLQGVRTGIGKAYAVNTVAAIFGSLIAGFWIIPDYGTDVLLTVMALVILVLPLIFIPVFPGLASRGVLSAIVLVALSINWLVPHIEYQKLISSVQYDKQSFQGKKAKFLFLKEGKAGVISMITYDDRHIKLQSNGLNESFIDLQDEQNILLAESFLGLIPYLIHKQANDAFVVGYGGGITTKALIKTKVKSIKVVELEPAVVEASKVIYPDGIEVLKDSRVTLEFNDARNTLLLDSTRYDIIASQPSHPWLARASNLFTQQFFEIVRSRLNDDGIYGQWVNLFHMDATTLSSIMKAFYQVFPYGMVLASIDSGDLLLFGSSHKLIFHYEEIARRMAEPQIKALLDYRQIYEPQDLFWHFSMSRAQALKAAGEVPANSDTNIFSEVRLSSLDKKGVGDEDPYEFIRKHSTFDITSYLEGDVGEKMYDLAKYFLLWDRDKRASQIAVQLKPVDEMLARCVDLLVLLYRGEFEKASDLFNAHNLWKDEVYYQMSVIFAQQNLPEVAKKVALLATDGEWQRTALVRILFEQKDWERLAAIKPQYDKERMWQLLGLAHSDLLAAGTTLAQLIKRLQDKIELEIPQLRLLIRYYGEINQIKQQSHYSRQLVDKMDKQIARLKKLANQAVNEKAVGRAKLLLEAIELLAPDKKKLRKLRKQIEKLSPDPVKMSL